jgi:hypothetical protein
VARLRVSDLGLVGLSYLAGWATFGLLATLALMLGAGESLPELLLLAVLAIAASLWLGRSAAPLPDASTVEPGHLAAVAVSAVSWAMIAIASASAAIVASTSQWSSTNDFDAFGFWIPKAEIVYASHGLDAQLWRLFDHPEYPPLAAATDAMTFFFSGLHPSLLPAQRTLIGIAFLLSLVTLLGRCVPRWLVLPFVAALATAGWFWGNLASVMVDGPTAYLVGAAAVTGFLWLVERHRAWLVLAWVFAAAASLTKFEGLFFTSLLVMTVVAAAFARYGRRGLPAAWLLLAPAGIVIWRIWLHRHGLPTANSTDYHLTDLLDPHYLSQRTVRLTRGLHAISGELQSLVATGSWTRFGPAPSGWLLALPWAAVLVLAGRRARTLAVAAALWALASLAGLAVIYWVARPPVGFYINVTIGRVVPTIVIAAAALVTLVLGVGLEGPERATVPVRSPWARAVAIAVAAGTLAVVALADARPGVDRSGKPAAVALARQLSTQFTRELASSGYDYSLTTTCDPSSADGLSYTCVVSTATQVGTPLKTLYWNVAVTCEPRATAGPRCSSDHGEALD